MDLREQDERFSSGQQSRTCATVLKILAAIGLLVAAAIMEFIIFGQVKLDAFGLVGLVVSVFWALVTAALLWAAATGLRILRQIEENTRGTTGKDTARSASTDATGPTSD
jgi:hypothetical protein